MKTSFAKTMDDLANGRTPSDLVFPDRESRHTVLWNDEEIKPDEIFVVRSYDEDYSSDEVSTLLANLELKKKYEEAHKQVATSKTVLDKRLRELAGFGSKSRENIDLHIQELAEGNYYEALKALNDELDTTPTSSISDANFKIIFDKKVQALLSNADINKTIADFSEKYTELTDSSPILRENFQYHHVTQVHQQLSNNNFFEAGHSVNLVNENGDEKIEYTSDADMLDAINSEKDRILNTPEVKSNFEKLNSKLTNKELQTFRDYITKNQHLITELQDMVGFKRKLWIQYLIQAKTEYDDLVQSYTNSQIELTEIVKQASLDRSDWDTVIEDFNRRFLHLPFQVFVENKVDVILEAKTPSIGFRFFDPESERHFGSGEKKELLRVLSTGEARALYILNIMFGTYTRWKSRKKTLFVFDDMADSFDYKNKFAIVDYLQEITVPEDSNFLAIVLTHNFDFLRTIESRGICKAAQCVLALKKNDQIVLEQFKQSDIRSPFQKWKKRINEPTIQIALIPFIRNLIEYSQGTKIESGDDGADRVENPTYQTLTRMLHFKEQSETLTIGDYKTVFDHVLENCSLPDENLDKSILEYIFETADACLDAPDGINLEHKIVLSIATRIWAERYMIEKLRETDEHYEFSTKQTGEIVPDYVTAYNNQKEHIRLARRVALITPANIHINAFMYEPILDMGFDELKGLYSEVKAFFV
ncbi:hypothetical protein GCM10007939_25920 [Amylibacter marinus]|uniref:Phage infection protein n=2 Tax=Amylibacter marinus TaxID=1475483 RepID=A0ABQ5VXZ4_9RHOB|nr:hypothetical protein GCM10007939_25920 [Amylibacter marinus]